MLAHYPEEDSVCSRVLSLVVLDYVFLVLRASLPFFMPSYYFLLLLIHIFASALPGQVSQFDFLIPDIDQWNDHESYGIDSTHLDSSLKVDPHFWKFD